MDDKSDGWLDSDTGMEWEEFRSELERWYGDLENIPDFTL